MVLGDRGDDTAGLVEIDLLYRVSLLRCCLRVHRIARPIAGALLILSIKRL
jgi:hypothetical protein